MPMTLALKRFSVILRPKTLRRHGGPPRLVHRPEDRRRGAATPVAAPDGTRKELWRWTTTLSTNQNTPPQDVLDLERGSHRRLAPTLNGGAGSHSACERPMSHRTPLSGAPGLRQRMVFDAKVCIPPGPDSAKIFGNAAVWQRHGSTAPWSTTTLRSSTALGLRRQVSEALRSSTAPVCENAQVFGSAWVFGNALVCDSARVFDLAKVSSRAAIYGNAEVRGNAWVGGSDRIDYNRS